MPTQLRVKELFDYNPLTGELTRKISVSNGKIKSGDVAGWLSNGYLSVRIDRKVYKVHRVIWLLVHGKFPEKIDHINHIRDDNRLCNLRAVSHQENHRNRTMQKNNSSGFTGVYWKKQYEKWSAMIHINGKLKHLGFFTNKAGAIEARKAANIEYGFHANHGRR